MSSKPSESLDTRLAMIRPVRRPWMPCRMGVTAERFACVGCVHRVYEAWVVGQVSGTVT